MKRYMCVLLALNTLFGQQEATKAPSAPAMNAGAKEAVALSESWTYSSGSRPGSGADGRVVYAFGAGLPTVVCAPLRICMIELQAGEEMTGEPQLGDTVRWHIAPAVYGSGPNKTQMIVIKPTDPDVETNLMIPTDRRTYYLRLLANPKDYIARTTFTYPDGDAAAWKRHAADVERDHQLIAAANDRPPMLPAIRAAEELDFNYVVTAKNTAIKPTKVFSDAAHTYFRMPEAIKAREAPALFVVNAEGKDELTNYRVADGTVPTYVVDRLADHFRLRLGVGKKAEVVEIKHGTRERT